MCAASLLVSVRPAALGQQPQAPPTLSDLTSGGTTPSRLAEAHRLLDANRFREAEAVLRALLRDDEPSAEAHALLGYALLRENRPAEALPEYTRSASLAPPSARLLEQVSQTYILLHDETDADHWALRAVRMEPGNADPWYGLGRVRFTEQRFADAVSCFQRALALAPDSVKVENNLGLALEGLNRLDEAAAAYQKAIAGQAGRPHPSEQPLLNLGTLRLHAGMLAEAGTLLTQAVAIAPDDVAIREQLGHLYLQQGKLPEARDAFSRAVELQPEAARFHFLLGQVERRLGDTAGAAAQFAEASRLAAQSTLQGNVSR